MAIDLMAEYTELERIMTEAENAGDESLVEPTRDLLDHLWYQMTDEQHRTLNQRGDKTHA